MISMCINALINLWWDILFDIYESITIDSRWFFPLIYVLKRLPQSIKELLQREGIKL
jgi:hypothetical protein